MNTIKNILSKLRGLPQKLGLERIIIYSALIVFIIISLSRCNKKPVPCDDCEAIKVEFAAEQVREALAVHSSTFDNKPTPTEVIEKEKIVYKNHTTFVKNWHELQTAKLELERARDEKNKLLNELQITKAQLDSIVTTEGSFSFDSFEPVTEPPLILTDKSEETDDYKIETYIYSRGPLETFNRSITVYPRTVTITQTEIEVLNRNNYLAFGAGALFIDDLKNLYYTPSLEYGHKWWAIEGAPLLNGDFKLKGGQAKFKIVFKWK